MPRTLLYRPSPHPSDLVSHSDPLGAAAAAAVVMETAFSGHSPLTRTEQWLGRQLQAAGVRRDSGEPPVLAEGPGPCPCGLLTPAKAYNAQSRPCHSQLIVAEKPLAWGLRVPQEVMSLILEGHAGHGWSVGFCAWGNNYHAWSVVLLGTFPPLQGQGSMSAGSRAQGQVWWGCYGG